MSDNGFPDLAAWLDYQAALSRAMRSYQQEFHAERLESCARHIRSLRKEIETLSDRLQELEKKKPLANGEQGA